MNNKRLDKYICPECGNIFYGYDYDLCRVNDQCVSSGEILKELYVFADCFSHANGKPGQFGGFTTLITNERFDLEDEFNIEKTIQKAFNGTTNNYNELAGVVYGLCEVTTLPHIDEGVIHKITVVSDSEYVIKGAGERMYKWKRDGWTNTTGKVKNLELWQKMLEVVSYIKTELHIELVFQHQKGHKGKAIPKDENPIIYLQEQCDTMSVALKDKLKKARK